MGINNIRNLLTKILFLVIICIFCAPIYSFAVEQSNEDVLDDLANRYGSNQNQPYIPVETNTVDSVFSIEIISFEKSISTGEKFACIVSYSVNANANNTNLSITIPDRLRCIEFYDHNLNTLEYTLATNGNQLTYTINIGDIPNNSIGNVVAVLKYADNDIMLDSSLTLYSNISSSSISTEASTSLELNSIEQEADWSVLCYQNDTEDTKYFDTDVNYGITLYGNSDMVDLDISDVTLKLNYPIGATVVNSDGGEVDENYGVITWQIPVIFVGESLDKNITINYPNQNFSALNQAIISLSANANGTLLITNEECTVDSYLQHTLIVPISEEDNEEDVVDDSSESNDTDDTNIDTGISLNYKALDQTEYTPGDYSTFIVYGIENNNSFDIDNIEIIYEVPSKTTLDYVKTGMYNRDVMVTVYYKYYDNDTWIVWNDASYLNNKELLATSIADKNNIEKVKWVIEKGNQNIGLGFSSNNTIQIGSIVNGEYGDIFDVTAATIITVADTSEQIVTTSNDTYKVFPIFPSDLSDKRKKIVETAYSLVGKVNYFWGGKCTLIGWDPQWGVVMKNDYIGTIEPYGMDCSGYTQWVFINSDFARSYIISNFGNGTKYQFPNSYEISMENVLPGDIAFRQTPSDVGINHVGIFVGLDEDGDHLVAHCSGSYDNVVVTKYSPTFHYTRRPNILMLYPN